MYHGETKMYRLRIEGRVRDFEVFDKIVRFLEGLGFEGYELGADSCQEFVRVADGIVEKIRVVVEPADVLLPLSAIFPEKRGDLDA